MTRHHYLRYPALQMWSVSRSPAPLPRPCRRCSRRSSWSSCGSRSCSRPGRRCSWPSAPSRGCPAVDRREAGHAGECNVSAGDGATWLQAFSGALDDEHGCMGVLSAGLGGVIKQRSAWSTANVLRSHMSLLHGPHDMYALVTVHNWHVKCAGDSNCASC